MKTEQDPQGLIVN